MDIDQGRARDKYQKIDQKDSRKAKGKAGEEAAAAFLRDSGYHIIDMNWRCKSGEIDIVAEHEDMYIFVEVRSRTGSHSYGTPLESVNYRKMNQVRRTAAVYLQDRRLSHKQIRFDVIGVLLHPEHWENEQAQIEHIVNAF